MAALWQVGDKNNFFLLIAQEGVHMFGLSGKNKQTEFIR